MPRSLTVPLALLALLSLAPAAGAGGSTRKINVPDPTGAAGCGTTFTQVVFGNPRILGP